MERNLSPDWEDVNAYADALAGRDYDVDTRLRLLLSSVTMGRSDWKAMELETGVKAEKWRQFARGSTKASVELVEAISLRWPQYAFWLVTGVSDEKHGHHAPNLIHSFPNWNDALEYQDEPARRVSSYEKTTEYFRLAARLARKVWSAGPPRTQMRHSVLEKDKTSKLRTADKQFDRDFRLLNVLQELKEDEFLQDNPHLEINEEFRSDALKDLDAAMAQASKPPTGKASPKMKVSKPSSKKPKND
jgi:hypothetical protein